MARGLARNRDDKPGDQRLDDQVPGTTRVAATNRPLHAFFTHGAQHSQQMEVLSTIRESAARIGAWLAARPYTVFLLAAAALGVASIVITLPPEVR